VCDIKRTVFRHLDHILDADAVFALEIDTGLNRKDVSFFKGLFADCVGRGLPSLGGNDS
jgi:hypothetical protein